MIKGIALLASPTELTAPDEPIVMLIGTGHADAAEVRGWATGRTGPTERILDAGMLLDYQAENPGRGRAAQELLTLIGAPDGILDQLRALVSGDPVTTTEHSKRVDAWAWDMITAPGGMVDTMPELGIPTGDVELGDPSDEDKNRADLKRMYLHLGAVWAVGMLARLVGQDTTDLVDEIVRRRAVQAATSTRTYALAVAA